MNLIFFLTFVSHLKVKVQLYYSMSSQILYIKLSSVFRLCLSLGITNHMQGFQHIEGIIVQSKEDSAQIQSFVSVVSLNHFPSL